MSALFLTSGLADFVPDQLQDTDFLSRKPRYAEFPTVMEKALAWIRESMVGNAQKDSTNVLSYQFGDKCSE